MNPVTDLSPAEPTHPKRPRRLPALYDGLAPLYFVSFNTYQRQSLLARPEVHRAFIEFCRQAETFRILVNGYVLMPEKTGQSLNAWIKALKSVLGKTLLILNVKKPHWQEGFFDHVLRSHEGRREKRDYILQNPVRAGFRQRPEDWPYQGEIVAL